MSEALTAIAYAAREKAKADAAAQREYEGVIEALTEVYDGTLPDPLPMRRDAIKALVRSSFFAGVNFELERCEAMGEGA